jgi:hypothetical protein
MENFTDPFTDVPEAAEVLVTAVLPHPLHGRLVEKLIFYVRPDLSFGGLSYRLTWWGAGVAYYQPLAGSG